MKPQFIDVVVRVEGKKETIAIKELTRNGAEISFSLPASGRGGASWRFCRIYLYCDGVEFCKSFLIESRDKRSPLKEQVDSQLTLLEQVKPEQLLTDFLRKDYEIQS